jgi:hypothetical protein
MTFYVKSGSILLHKKGLFLKAPPYFCSLSFNISILFLENKSNRLDGWLEVTSHFHKAASYPPNYCMIRCFASILSPFSFCGQLKNFQKSELAVLFWPFMTIMMDADVHIFQQKS